ncbi:hypothetical protein ACIBCR_14745 [Micromonospora echinospora]|uniref:hypothetical protein n=1 Tax=Micromonospora echinospora TaxID=1877 RepID=UPI0037A31C0E
MHNPIESRGSDSGRPTNQPPAGVFVGRAHLDRNAVRIGEVDGPTAILPSPTLSLPGMNTGSGYTPKGQIPDGDVNRHPFSRAEAWVPQPRTTWVIPS